MIFGEKNYIVYLLINTCEENNRTYLGITNNCTRRIKQHNGIIKGGAKYTTAFKGTGEWEYYLQVKNLTKKEALSIERTAKIKRKGAKGTNPIEKRLNVILPLLGKYPECHCEYYKDTNISTTNKITSV